MKLVALGKFGTKLSKSVYRLVGCCLLFMLVATLSYGFEIKENGALDSPELEARARGITSDLMCPVCSGQSVDESDAELARDIRRAVRERVLIGDTDAEVRDWLRSRYGEEVLMTPVVESHTFALWGGPVFFLIIGVALLIGRRRAYRKQEAKDA